VTDLDGKVRISAKKGDLNVNDGKETVLLAQGQETTRDDSSNDEQDGKKKKRKRNQSGAVPAAGGGLLNSPWAVGAGGAAVVGVTTWVLIQSSNPASPAKP
jgi:hypothetical protein